jgi:hypothetical protein
MSVSSGPHVSAPIVLPRQITVALDMAGCPSRCRHCYLGQAPGGALHPDDLRWTVAQFRVHVQAGETAPFFEEIKVSSWVREPDFAPDYRALHALEAELGDGEPDRFELLSIHRLARDPSYARWAHEVGTRACQISFFGVGATQDWFCRRKGAFEDCLAATEQLLAHGIAPRWQIFVTRKLLPELEELLGRIDRLELRERTEATGRPFEVFMHTPAPDGEARQIEQLRPYLAEMASLPEWLVQASRTYLGRECMWRTEAEWMAQLETQCSEDELPRPFAYAMPRRLVFYVLPDWSVYTNVGTLEPWWRLGDLRTEGLATILSRLERAEPLGLDTILRADPLALARSHGDPQGQRIYDSLDDLLGLYVGRYCAARSVRQIIEPSIG